MAAHSLAAALGAQGRGGDRLVGHLTPGEIVVPKRVQTRKLRDALVKAMLGAGLDPEDFIVGGPDRVNPRTGLREYFVGGAFGGAGIGGIGFGGEGSLGGTGFGEGDFGGDGFGGSGFTPGPSTPLEFGKSVITTDDLNFLAREAGFGVDPPGVATGFGLDFGRAGDFGFDVTSFDEGKGGFGFMGFMPDPAMQPGPGIGDPAFGQPSTTLGGFVSSGAAAQAAEVVGAFFPGLGVLGLLGKGLPQPPGGTVGKQALESFKSSILGIAPEDEAPAGLPDVSSPVTTEPSAAGPPSIFGIELDETGGFKTGAPAPGFVDPGDSPPSMSQAEVNALEAVLNESRPNAFETGFIDPNVTTFDPNVGIVEQELSEASRAGAAARVLEESGPGLGALGQFVAPALTPFSEDPAQQPFARAPVEVEPPVEVQDVPFSMLGVPGTAGRVGELFGVTVPTPGQFAPAPGGGTAVAPPGILDTVSPLNSLAPPITGLSPQEQMNQLRSPISDETFGLHPQTSRQQLNEALEAFGPGPITNPRAGEKMQQDVNQLNAMLGLMENEDIMTAIESGQLDPMSETLAFQELQSRAESRTEFERSRELLSPNI